MDVDQRLDEIRQMAVGLRDLGLAPESHGHLLAALYFCEGVTALPAVVGQFSELHHAECRNSHAELEDRLIDVQNHAVSFRNTVIPVLTENTNMLMALVEGAQIQMQALTRIITGRGGTDETIPVGKEGPAHKNGWRDENGTTTQAVDSGDESVLCRFEGDH